jgi:hypothetical protein
MVLLMKCSNLSRCCAALLLLTDGFGFTQSINAQSEQPIHPAQLELSPPNREEYLTALADPQWEDKRWVNGSLVVHKTQATPLSAVAALFRPDRKPVWATVWFENAETVGISSATATKEGHLLVAGSVERRKRGNSSFSSFIAEIGEDGKPARVIETGARVPLRICAAANNILSYGWDRTKYSRGSDYPLLAAFSFERGLLYSDLNHSTYVPKGTISTQNFAMECTDDQAVLLISASSQILRIDATNGKVVKQTSFTPFGKSMGITGFAVTQDGTPYVSFLGGKEPTGYLGLLALREDATGTAEWQGVPQTFVSATGVPPNFSQLIGSDGNAIVYQRRIDDPRIFFGEVK